MNLEKLGRYDLLRVLGKGAMGLVYEGRDPNLDRRVAIKTIQVENLSVQAAIEYEHRFRTEARSAARLQHPNIVSVYDAGRDGNIAFLVMEFIQGEDLKHHLNQGELYTLGQTVGILGDLLSALDYAHQQNIVHRDIKPANLLIEACGRVKLTDFGVARIQDSGEATRTQGALVGTLKYMSPEQVRGYPIDARSDLFGAGIVLYQLLTGQRPFDGTNDFAIIQQIVGHTPAPPSSVNPLLPPAIDAVVARALAKSREQRFANAQAFATALQTAMKDVSEATIGPPAATPGSRHATWTATLGSGEAQVGTTPAGSGAEVPTVTQELELVYWKDVKDSADSEDIQGFLARFPGGIYAGLAHRRLKALGAPTDDWTDSGSYAGTRTVLLPRPVSEANPLATRTRPIGQGGKPPEETTGPSPERTPPLPVAPADGDALALADVVVANQGAATVGLRDAKVSVSAMRPRPGARRWGWALAGVVGVIFVAGAGTGELLSRPAIPLAVSVAVPAPAAVLAAAPGLLEAAAEPETGFVDPVPAHASTARAVAHAASKLHTAVVSLRPAEWVKKFAAEKAGLTRQAPAVAADPRPACENHILLAFQICMAEQCAKPAFTRHPVCVERRAMEQQRRDAMARR